VAERKIIDEEELGVTIAGEKKPGSVYRGRTEGGKGR